MASVQRQPFGELGSSRLQGLNAQKNCQNAITDLLSKPSSLDKPKTTLTSPAKRPYTPIFDDEDFDSENVDPALVSSKRSKALDGSSKPHFRLATTFSDPSKTLAGSGAVSDKLSTPVSPLADKFAFSALPTGASSAPAGRSPKHKRVGLLSKKYPTASPIRRIDPPRFGAAKKSSAGLPFSIDAALTGTLSSYNAPAPAVVQKAPAAPVEEPMPKGWFFDIHEDTPEEEAANLMEHSTCILDISSDDEAGRPNPADDRGKENVPPPDHEHSSDATALTEPSSLKPRRSVHADAMVDDGQERAPLGMLSAEDFYAQGLDAKSVHLVLGEPDEMASSEAEAGHVPTHTEGPAAKEDPELADEHAGQSTEITPIQVHEDNAAASEGSVIPAV